MNGPDWYQVQWMLDAWLREQSEQKKDAELLRADPAYVEWLDKLEQDSKHDERK